MDQLKNKLNSLTTLGLLKSSTKDGVIRFKPTEGHTFYAHNIKATIAMEALDIYRDGRVVTWVMQDGKPTSTQLKATDFGIQNGDTLTDVKVV